MVAAAGPVSAKDKVHYLAVHVDDSNPATMNLALNNVQNVRTYYASKGEKAIVEVVAYGPGLKMYMADSPVKARIETMALESSEVQFSACANTHRKMSEKAGKDIPLLVEAKMVPSGVIRLIELQEGGYSYLRP
ncbi:MAG: hypothetical protein COW30_14070 [Rhodospirillales bacterium CG15_BIG_FIL_POST_REV_8_21_14_020_66_15]|nr:MAG: hypothetical protein COW30_14070 [Rhodospirillales bacterium CG15_BIG_FIL_POST_REV_8_21_14_020_66_15]